MDALFGGWCFRVCFRVGVGFLFVVVCMWAGLLYRVWGGWLIRRSVLRRDLLAYGVGGGSKGKLPVVRT